MSSLEGYANGICLVMPTLLGPVPAALATLERLRRTLKEDHRIAAEIWIIDNGGVVPNRADVHVVDPGTNLGFGRAVNWWARQQRGVCSTFVLWNDDLAANDGDAATISRCAEQLATWHRKAVAGAIITSVRHDVLLSPGTMDALVGLAGVRRAAPLMALRGRAGVPVPGAMAWVLPREEFETLGGFDEAYPLYYEDADYALRREEAGRARFELCEVDSLVHVHSRTTKTMGDPTAVVAVTAYSTGLWLQRRCGRPRRVSGALVAAALVVRLVVDATRRRRSGVTRVLLEEHLRGNAREPALPARLDREAP